MRVLVSHIGLIALIVALVAFVIYTGRPRPLRRRTDVGFSIRPESVQIGAPIVVILDFPAGAPVTDVRIRIVCYSAVRNILLRKWSGPPMPAERDAQAAAGVQRFVARAAFPHEAELWSYDIDPRGTWTWRIEAAATRGGMEWTEEFDVRS